MWIKELPLGSDVLNDVGLEFINLPPHVTENLKTLLEERAE